MNVLAKAISRQAPVSLSRFTATEIAVRLKAPSTIVDNTRRMIKSQAHYEGHTANSYESAFFYEEGAYTQYLCDLVAQRLGLEKNSTGTLVDIGGGTGNFTRMLVEKAPKINAIVVDPFLPESSSSSGDQVKFVKASAEAYMEPATVDDWRWQQKNSQVLLKEVIHHLEKKDRPAIFQGMLQSAAASTEQQPSTPALLIITRPQREIDYPLWKEARDIWAANQPHVNELMMDLRKAGFQTVDYTVEAYPCEISLKRWQAMVRQRFWSTFANFTDSELEAACLTMAAAEAHRVDEHGIVRFEDRLVFLRAFA